MSADEFGGSRGAAATRGPAPEARASGPGEVARFLTQTVLDLELRELARRASEEAFAGFDLSEEDKETLRLGDVGMLRLLGAALRAGEPVAAGGEDDSAPSDARLATAPHAAPAPASTRLPGLSFVLNVEPSVVQTPEGLRVTCAVSMQQISQAPLPTAPATAAPSAGGHPGRGWSAWDHVLDSEAVRDATAAVRSASPEERFDRILDMIAAMTSHERVGGRVG